ncbi:hypothetical protein [Melghirimyces algeriensis]|nr:hypothetical protein [Melghirimyces algeriensis]
MAAFNVLLKYFDVEVGFEQWSELTNPNVYEVGWPDFTVKRIWEEEKISF